MNKFTAVCRVLGCPNFGTSAYLITDDLELTNVVCGACGQQITDITNQEVRAEEPIIDESLL